MDNEMRDFLGFVTFVCGILIMIGMLLVGCDHGFTAALMLAGEMIAMGVCAGAFGAIFALCVG